MTDRLSDNLLRRARYWAGEITKKARSYAPSHLKKTITSHVQEIQGGTFSITTISKAADALAWEHGSGLHKRDGRRTKKKYIIQPRTKKLLAFHWDVADANPEKFTWVPDGSNRVSFHFVMHPGI